MSSFVPTKRNLRESLLFCFHLKKSAAESLRLLTQAYGEKNAPSISTCEYWFRRFKSGNFDTVDKERPGQPKKFEDSQLEALIKENPCKRLRDLAESLNVDLSTISKRKLKKNIQTNKIATKISQINKKEVKRKR